LIGILIDTLDGSMAYTSANAARGFHCAWERSTSTMFQRKTAAGLLLAMAMMAPSFAVPRQDQSAKGDLKDAQQSTNDAAQDTGRATKKTAQETGHTVKHKSKKAAHKTAKKTKLGAQKVEDKTQPQ